jgi:hypothetical protein
MSSINTSKIQFRSESMYAVKKLITTKSKRHIDVE